MTAYTQTLQPGDTLAVSAAVPPPPPVVVPPRHLGWWHSDQDISIAALETAVGRPIDGGRTFDAYGRSDGSMDPQDVWLANAGLGRCVSLKLDMYDKIIQDLNASGPTLIKTWSANQLALPGKAWMSIDHEADAKASQAHAAGQHETFPAVFQAWVNWLRKQPAFDPKRHFPTVITTNYLFKSRIAGVWPGAAYSPYLGLDVYDTVDPAAAVADALAFAKAQGVKMVWPEWGYIENATSQGPQKADLIRQYAAFAKSTPEIEWICYWSGSAQWNYDTSPASKAAYIQTGQLLQT